MSPMGPNLLTSDASAMSAIASTSEMAGKC